jgi:hypothetical protein
MRIFLVLICSLALACVALGEEQGKNKEKEQPKKKGAQAGQVAQPGGRPTGAGKPTGAGRPVQVGKATGGASKKTSTGAYEGKGKSGQTSMGNFEGKKGQTSMGNFEGKKGKPTGAGKPAEVGKASGAGAGKPTGTGKPAEVGKATGAGKPVTAGGPGGKKFQAQQFNLQNKNKARPEVAPAVAFQQNRHIEGSQNWNGSQYNAFRNYSSEWHDRNWWSGHSNNVVFVFGGWYALNAGYWYPAWGYDSNAYYPYDGPIYAYNSLPPDQVIANVQTALQQQGYYQGEVDGLLGPQTRAAIADYQRANGLAETAAIDQPTLESLGMS